MISASIPNVIRKAIYRREGYACALCGDPRSLQIHHAIPRSAGGGNSPFNLICLCKYCHGNAHGIHLSELVIDPDEVEQACVEYLSDMYAGGWCPLEHLDYSDSEMVEKAKEEARQGLLFIIGNGPKWAGTTYDWR